MMQRIYPSATAGQVVDAMSGLRPDPPVMAPALGDPRRTRRSDGLREQSGAGAPESQGAAPAPLAGEGTGVPKGDLAEDIDANHAVI